jgi:hypothetical protein
MKKYFSFDRIMLVLILIVLSFNFYKTNENIFHLFEQHVFKQQCASFYSMFDYKRKKTVGYFCSSKTVQKDQIIFLDDDVYKVNSIKCFLNCSKKDKDGDILYSEYGYELYVEFLGKSIKREKELN